MSLAETSPRVSPRVRGIDEITLANETNERFYQADFTASFLIISFRAGRRGEAESLQVAVTIFLIFPT